MQLLALATLKPLICVNGRCLSDQAPDILEKAQVKKAVVNVHHLTQQICDHTENDIQNG